MSVITISRQFGSGGDEIAYRISQEMDYRLFDKHMIWEAAKASGLADQKLVDDIQDYSEDNHQVRGLLDILFESMPVIPNAGVWPDDLAAQYTLEELRLQRMERLRLVQKAVQYAYQVGNVVIVGRGGQVLLKDQPEVFHIRIIAPLETRYRLIHEQLERNQGYSTDLMYRDNARIRELIAQRDATSADYIHCFYHVHWDDPLLYHLVINTGKVRVNQAVQMVIKLIYA